MTEIYDNFGEVLKDTEPIGISDETRARLGHEVGKLWYCPTCYELTLNVPAPEVPDDLRADDWTFRNGRKVAVTKENYAELFFVCEYCGTKKYWRDEDLCPVCGYDHAAVLEMTEPKFVLWVSMEYGGNPLEWREKWRCLLCGHEYWVTNANY